MPLGSTYFRDSVFALKPNIAGIAFWVGAILGLETGFEVAECRQ
jgi:hypothetical protein